MDIQSLSGIVLIVLALVIIGGIIPTKTMKSLNNATRHSEDKYSSSLHVIDEAEDSSYADHTDTGNSSHESLETAHNRRFDARTVRFMRGRRRAGIRRRRFLVLSLILATGIVAACAYGFAFSFWFVAIPSGLLALVLGAGIAQNKRTRAWEKDYARYRKNQAVAARAVNERGWLTTATTITRDAGTGNYSNPIDTSDNADTSEEIEQTPTEKFHDIVEHAMDDEALSREIRSIRQVSVAIAPQEEKETEADDTEAVSQISQHVHVDSILEMRRQ